MEVDVHLGTTVAPEMWLKCSVAKKTGAEINDTEAWESCVNKVNGSVGACDVQLAHVQAGIKPMMGYCVLTEGNHGKRLTNPTWITVENHHQDVMMAAARSRSSAVGLFHGAWLALILTVGLNCIQLAMAPE